ncbi:hypothetical protein SLEP1_g3253 [Rubroshorea leprosula]|uniref:Uncharacterized protein n=1 Tax=Rubroshorea leprosula TaxID=152421 RepID=A0AAV5HJR4_9ROSI|nr:hypothetical protein SLEP1_g3253 [Rubroshorea leprosula]
MLSHSILKFIFRTSNLIGWADVKTLDAPFLPSSCAPSVASPPPLLCLAYYLPPSLTVAQACPPRVRGFFPCTVKSYHARSVPPGNSNGWFGLVGVI